MTGRYYYYYGSIFFSGFGNLQKGLATFGNVLRDAGYATFVGGKWQLRSSARRQAAAAPRTHNSANRPAPGVSAYLNQYASACRALRTGPGSAPVPRARSDPRMLASISPSDSVAIVSAPPGSGQQLRQPSPSTATAGAGAEAPGAPAGAAARRGARGVMLLARGASAGAAAAGGLQVAAADLTATAPDAGDGDGEAQQAAREGLRRVVAARPALLVVGPFWGGGSPPPAGRAASESRASLRARS